MKGAYITLSHYEQVNKEAAAQGQKEVAEECEFLDRIKDKHYTHATVIVDCKNEKLIKCRAEGKTYNDIISHIQHNYPSKYKEFLKITGLLKSETKDDGKVEDTEEQSVTDEEE